ncbi:MAG: VWA domain-containing protein [Actinomycetota bacterium]
MISGLCGFAERVRHHGGDVGAAELIDSARALTLVDLADRAAVEGALRLTMSWATTHPGAFGSLFDAWFSADGFDLPSPDGADAEGLVGVALDAETIDAARIHTEDALAVEDRGDDANGATSDTEMSGSTPAPARPDDSGAALGAHEGELAAAPPSEEGGESVRRSEDVVVALPSAPPDTGLELARSSMSAALERRHRSGVVWASSNAVTAVTTPLTTHERTEIVRCVRRLDRELRGAPSWRRRPAGAGSVDLRRTLRRSVTTAGFPIDVRHLDRRHDAARLVVLVDLSLSVRGTSRLVLHLLHRLRSSVGSLRTFGFIDAFVPIDRALRTDDAVRAIGAVLGGVDLDASSDPGRALRTWWSRWHHLVTPETHVVILSDGRCNGNDPGYETVRKITARSASTLWISPEPRGAWSLGRGEMVEFAACVDQAVTVRTIDDLAGVTALRRRRLSSA